MKILIVDDSKAMRLLITRALKEIGLAGSLFLEASNGEQALKTLEEAAPDVIFCDFNMPGMSGMELLRKIRSGGIKIPFGFVTSEASAELRQEASESGALFVVTKPFTAANLSLTLAPLFASLGCQTASVDDQAPAASAAPTGGFPKAAQVAGLLKGLLPRAVAATPLPSTALPPVGGHVVAEFENVDDGQVVACAVCDLPGAIRLGAVFTLIPSGAAADAIRAGSVEPVIAENFHEVLSIMSRLFEGSGSRRVRLGAVHWPGQPLLADLADLANRIRKPGVRTDLALDIAGYGKGNLTLLSLS